MDYVSPDEGIGSVLKTLAKGGASVSLTLPSFSTLSLSLLPSLKRKHTKEVYRGKESRSRIVTVVTKQGSTN